MYETFLSTVPLLSGLNTWEKAKIADALETEVFDSGEVVIAQGDVGEYFYLVESGEAEVIIEGRGVVRQYKRGDYFGGTYILRTWTQLMTELALLNDAPRAATVRALSSLKVAKLDKRAFQRLMGPIKDIMARNDPRLQHTS
jgi:cAMP-dependent protein kinase regulator